MLFGRKKPGFLDSFDNAELETEDTAETEETIKPEKMDLSEYLDELNKDDELANLSEQTGETEEVEEIDDRTETEILADFIRERSRASYLTGKAFLQEEDESIDELLEKLKEDESCKDIVSIKGDKDIYFYSTENMSDNYAMIATFVEDANLPNTIAEMVRWNAKTYPCPTPIYYFNRSPYNYTNEQIENAIEVMKKEKKYEDVGEVITGNNVRYLYSTLHMTEKYARALAEDTEYGEYGYL